MKITYFDLVRWFYESGIAEELSTGAICVAHTIMYKANIKFFPDSFRMTNRELGRISGLSKDHVRKQRNELLIKCRLFGYKTLKHYKGGEYSVDYASIKLAVGRLRNNPNMSCAQNADDIRQLRGS